MKNLLLPILAIVSLHATHAQNYPILHPNPPGLPVGSQGRANHIAVDPLNNKWISYTYFGLGKYDGATWTVYNTTNSLLPSDSVTCSAFDASGTGWVGTKMGLVKMDPGGWIVYNQINSGLPSNIITALKCYGNTVWIGTTTGLVSYDGTNWIQFNTGNSGLPNDSVTVIHQDGSGVLWIGTRNGLAKFANGNWSSYTTQNSPLYRYIYDIESDAYGRTWVAHAIVYTTNVIQFFNIHYLHNNTFYIFTENLYYYDIPVNANKCSFAKDVSGAIYFMVGFDNLFKINGGSLTYFILPVSTSSFGNIVIFDNNNTLWSLSKYQYKLYSASTLINQSTNFNELHFDNHRTIDINGVKAGINVAGDMHWDLANASHEVPKGAGKHSVFASALWIGALDAGGQLHMAAQTYRQTGEDYVPGPIGSISIPFDSTSCFQFNRIWKMNRWKIEQFKDQFQNGNVTNGTYTIPNEISTWPAKGNGIVNDHLAPFVDFNADGIYNPIQGDYPDIKGDQMLFYIFNDSLPLHTKTGGNKLGVEVQASVYAYNCSGIVDSLSVLNYTTLYHYTIINRSQTDYSNVYMGIWSDMDLGNLSDDYVGCDSTRAAGFTYNADNYDDGAMGYGLNPPMQNVKILRGTLAPPNDGLDNNLNGMIDEPGERTTMNHFQHYQNDGTVMGNPYDKNHYYQYLQSRWKDSTHVTYGSNGYNPSGTPSNFMFSGVPYSGTGWTELSSGNFPSDHRFLVGSGPFSLAAGDTATLDFAFIFTRDSLNPNGLTTSIARNQADLDRVQSWFEQNNFPSCEVYVTGLQEATFEKLALYPNPAITHLFLNGAGHNAAGIPYTIYDAMGKAVRRGITATDGSINISSLPQQVYILQTEAGRGRFVKM